MTYLEYFKDHPNENLGWCKPFVDKSERNYLIVYDGEVEGASMDGKKFYGYNGTLTDIMKDFAETVNIFYSTYCNQTDEYIALDAMKETGCASCPFRYDCETMYEDYPKN